MPPTVGAPSAAGTGAGAATSTGAQGALPHGGSTSAPMGTAGTATNDNGGMGSVTPNPTPNAAGMSVGGAAAVPDPPEPLPTLIGSVMFSMPSGTFEGELSLELTTDVTGAEIRYTTDGTPPTADSDLYDAALILDDTTQVRAAAFVDGAQSGEPSTALFVARTFDATSDIPLIIVDGYGGGKPEDKDVYLDMAFLVFEPVDGAASLSAEPTVATRAGYHLRGQSSANFEKAPYRVELWDNTSEDADYPLLGMPAEADWALIGPYPDRALIRHAFAYSLGAEMGLVTPRYAFAEVYINYDGGPLEPSHYEGVYMVVETIKNQKNRLDLEQLTEADTAADVLSGGYIFKFDWAASEEPTLPCTGDEPLSGGFMGGGNQGGGGTCWTDLEVVDPVPLAPEQAAYLTDYVQTFHDSLHADAFATYSQHIDVGSFVDQFLVNELTRDIDAYTRSAYYHKDRDGLLVAGPLWDYNLTLGVGFGGHRETEGWQWQEREVASDWFRILGQDPDFLALASQRWQELRLGILSDAALQARVDMLTAPLAGAAERDFQRWPVGDVSSFFQLPSDPTWQGQIDFLRQWVTDRVAWLDTQL